MLHPIADATIKTTFRTRQNPNDPQSPLNKPKREDVLTALLQPMEKAQYTSVSSIATTPPASPTAGQKVLVGASGTGGVFVGKENQIAEWSGTAWLYGAPVTGDEVYVVSIADKRTFDGAAWGVLALTTSPQTLTAAQQTVVAANLGFGTSNSAYIISSDILPTSGVVTQTQFDALLAAAASSGKAIYVPPNALHDMGSVTKVLTSSKLIIDGKGTFRRSGVIAAPILEFQGGSPTVEGVSFEYTAASTPVSGACQALLFNACSGAKASGVNVIGKWYVGIESRDGLYDLIEGCSVSGAVNRSLYHTALSRQSIGVKFAGNTALGYDLGTSTRLTAYTFNTNCFSLAAASITDAVYDGNVFIGAANHSAGIGDLISNSVFSNNAIRDASSSSPCILVQYNSFYARRPSGLVISGNATSGGAFSLQVNCADRLKIEGNLFNGATSDGIQIFGADRASVQGNSIHRPQGGYIIYALQASAPLVSGGSATAINCVDVQYTENQSFQDGTAASNGGLNNHAAAVRTVAKNNTFRNCGFPVVLNGSTPALNYNNDSI